ncbi:MAG TPA: hypothetical protein VFO35_20785 [Steroidobacteraceae bacterium]|nr:hypothetical protein [Steroidobacteraceae bacterium]
MLFKLRESSSCVVRPRVTPDPQRAAELEKRFSELAYSPENGFHRDQRQNRRVAPKLVLVPR